MSEEDAHKLPASVRAYLERLYRDPRYLLMGKVERWGRERIAFIEACTVISATGEVQGQLLLNREYHRRGRPDGERPYGTESLLDLHLQSRRGERISLSAEELGALQEESWQYYVRRNFGFLLGDYAQAQEDAEHNLGIWHLIEGAEADEATKWGFLKWWPWIERDRAIAQALCDLEQDEREHAAAELYRAQRSIQQFGERHAEEYAAEEGDHRALCAHMAQHIAGLVELLRRDMDLPTSREELLDLAAQRGDEEEVRRLRAEMIREAMEDSD